MNKGKWIRELIQDYMYVDGKHLGEKGKKNWLQDDYVKFIRFAQWRIEQTGYGILAFITNHGYLDNPTFRGMRQSLMETFNDIFILDLHGSSKEAGHSPDGSKDENVFDQIQQGVAIGVFVKSGSKKKKPAAIRHAHLWGLRGTYKDNVHGEQALTGGKYHWLWQNDLSTTEWASLKPQSPFYLFIPQNTEMKAEYEQGWKISKLMPHWGAGIITARDRFIIDYEDTPLRKRLEMFRNPELDDQWISDNLHVKDNSMWSMSKARKSFQQHPLDENLFVDIHYRPFDRRRTYYHTNVVFNMRTQVMRHMLAGKNLGLITSRMTKGEKFRHVQVTRNIAECYLHVP